MSIVQVCVFVVTRSMAHLKRKFGFFHIPRAEDLQAEKFELIFTHPEVAVSNRQCRDLFLSDYYQRAVVVDEAHCIIEW